MSRPVVRKGGNTPPSSFRLEPETVADLDTVAEYQTRTTGVRHSRTDALRLAARQAADRVRRKGKPE